MTKISTVIAVGTLFVLGGTCLLVAQAPPPQTPPMPMSFFVTSVGNGDGANLGGLAGADAHCQALAVAAGAANGSKTWHAYLSTQAANGQPAVNARDRIGAGPWYNAKGVRVAKDVGDLHGDTLDQARLGNALTKANDLTEKGDLIKGVGDTPNEHDMLTGSMPDGRAYTDTADQLRLQPGRQRWRSRPETNPHRQWERAPTPRYRRTFRRPLLE